MRPLTAEEKNQIDVLDGLGYSHRKIAKVIFKDGSRKSTVWDYLKKRGNKARTTHHVSEDNKANILLADIESSMQIAGSFGRFNVNLSEAQILEHTKLLCVCAKWLGEDEMMELAPEKFSSWDTKDQQERMLKKVWRVLDKADYIIGHNFAAFDQKMLNGYFLRYGLSKPSPYKVIDTLKIARQNFRLDSNKLDSIGAMLGVGRKTVHTGADLWIRCHKGHTDAFKDMIEYCNQDVLLLEEVYLKIRAWDSTHPDLTAFSEARSDMACPICTSEDLTDTGKLAYTGSYAYTLYQCLNCGGWHRSQKSVESFKNVKGYK